MKNKTYDPVVFIDKLFDHYHSILADEAYIELLLMTIKMHIDLTDSKELWVEKFSKCRNVKIFNSIENIKIG